VFSQEVLDTVSFYADIETGYVHIIEFEKHAIYFKETEHHIYYIWNDGKYTFKLTTNSVISTEELKLIIEGIK
jgi:hypothetical protein